MTKTLDLSPAKLDIVVQQGSRALATLTFSSGGVGLDLTGYLARMKVRSTPAGTVLLSLATDTSGLTWVDAATGQLEIDISAVVLAAVTPTIGVYDLELVPSDGIGGHTEAHARAYLSGSFKVKAEVTK